MKIQLFLLLASALIFGCRQIPTDGGTSKSCYLIGDVRRSPVSPIELPGKDDSAPLAGAPIHISGSNLDTTLISDSSGYFILNAPAGVYAIHPEELSGNWPTPPPAFGAVVGQSAPDTTVLHISYETHIR